MSVGLVVRCWARSGSKLINECFDIASKEFVFRQQLDNCNLLCFFSLLREAEEASHSYMAMLHEHFRCTHIGF